MAAAVASIRNSAALLDPPPEAAGKAATRRRDSRRADPAVASAYHRAGSRLLEAALRSGRRDDAFAATAFFRSALEDTPNDPTILNDLGVSLTELARTESGPAVLQSMEDALLAFRSAASEARRQVAPPATYLRYDINLAMILWMLGEQLGEHWRITESVVLLRSALNELSAASASKARIEVDWARAQDNLGNALMALGQPDEAIQAYEAALDRLEDPTMRAGSLNNLGTALVDAGHYPEARNVYHEALKLLARGDRPLAWARLQHNLGGAYFREAQVGQQTSTAKSLYEHAIAAYAAARETRQHSGPPEDLGATTVNLANAIVGLGAQLAQSNLLPAAIDHIQRGIGLYEEALPRLTEATEKEARHNYRIARDIIGHLLDSVLEYNDLRVPFTSNMAPANVQSSVPLNEHIFENFIKLLSDSGIPRSKWAHTCAELAARLGDEAGTPHRPATGSEALPIPPEARKLFGDAPPSMKPRTYTKSDFPAEWFDNKEIVAAARKSAVDYKNRDKSTPLTLAEVERGRAAARFIKAYELRQKKARTSQGAVRLGPRPG